MFPTAAEMRADDGSKYELYLFEEELKSILRLIFFAAKSERQYTYVSKLSKQAKSFLKEKEFDISKDISGWRISWEAKNYGDYKNVWTDKDFGYYNKCIPSADKYLGTNETQNRWWLD